MAKRKPVGQGAKPSLRGRVAIVTGAQRGMGAAIAQLLAMQGVAVCLNDVDEAGLGVAAARITAAGGRAITCAGSVTSESAVKEMVRATVNALGSVHILVNNAGVLRPTRVEQITEEEFDFVMDVSVKGCFLCSREVIPLMKAQRWGRIINMSSSAGRSVSTLGGCHYTAAKAAMLGLTRAMAKELGAFGITVNAICPGLIDTEMVRSTVSAGAIQRYEQSFPIPRLGSPEEVAALAHFLASDAASYITGASIDINGGDLML